MLAEQIVADLGAALAGRSFLRLSEAAERGVGPFADRRFGEIQRLSYFGIAFLLREQEAKYRTLVGGELF